MDITGTPYKPVRMKRYPHLTMDESEVWDRFLKAAKEEIRSVYYDVWVGGPKKGLAGPAQQLTMLEKGTLCKRIDVVCQVKEKWWVCEIKPFGNYVALGQVLYYVQAFEDEIGPGQMIVPVIVCYEADKDLVSTFSQHQVIVIEVGFEKNLTK